MSPWVGLVAGLLVLWRRPGLRTRLAALIAIVSMASACVDEAGADGDCPAGTTQQETVADDGATESWCMTADGTAHGPYVRTSDDGLEARGAFEHGLKAHTWEFFHPDGQTPRLEGQYTDGVVDGAWRAFDEAGRLSARRWYRLATPCGVWETLVGDAIVSTTDFGGCDLTSRGQALDTDLPAVVDTLDCPDQTTLRAGMDDMWCEDADGLAQGPYQRLRARLRLRSLRGVLAQRQPQGRGPNGVQRPGRSVEGVLRRRLSEVRR